MTKEEFLEILRKNDKSHDWCNGLDCNECPFGEFADCEVEIIYYLLEAYNELKEKYDEVIYSGN